VEKEEKEVSYYLVAIAFFGCIFSIVTYRNFRDTSIPKPRYEDIYKDACLGGVRIPMAVDVRK